MPLSRATAATVATKIAPTTGSDATRQSRRTLTHNSDTTAAHTRNTHTRSHARTHSTGRWRWKWWWWWWGGKRRTRFKLRRAPLSDNVHRLAGRTLGPPPSMACAVARPAAFLTIHRNRCGGHVTGRHAIIFKIYTHARTARDDRQNRADVGAHKTFARGLAL